MLGPVQQKHQDHPKPKSRSPSYFRRQERRRAAKAASSSEQSSDIVNAAEANTKQISEERKDADEATSPAEEKEYLCELCDFKSNRENGLRIHMSKKHATIEQLDGNTEEVLAELESELDDEIEHYLSTREIERTNSQILEDISYYLGNNKQRLIVLDSENNRQEKHHVLEAWKNCIDRKFGPGAHVEWNPWNNLIYF